MEYLGRYDHDPKFCSELEELYARTIGSTPPPDPPAWPAGVTQIAKGGQHSRPKLPLPDGSPELHRYQLAVDALAQRWGLDLLIGQPGVDGRLDDPQHPPMALPDGAGYINAWCLERQRHPDSTPASSFSSCAAHFYSYDEFDIRVDVHLVATWNPLVDAQSVAQKKLLARASKMIHARLEEIAIAAGEAGLHFGDTESNRARDLTRIFELATGRTTIADLAAVPGETDEAVKQAVLRMGKRVAIRTNDFFRTSRTSRPNH
jgi:hypothetical protein